MPGKCEALDNRKHSNEDGDIALKAVLFTIFECLAKGGSLEGKDVEILKSQRNNPSLEAIIAGYLPVFLETLSDKPGKSDKILLGIKELTGLAVKESHVSSGLIYLIDNGSMENLLKVEKTG